MKYFLSARSEKEASDYFYVLPDSGDVILSKPLSESKKTMFTVRRTCLLLRILVGGWQCNISTLPLSFLWLSFSIISQLGTLSNHLF